MKVVFVLGIGHSGSTLLDLMLSGSPDVCGMGEIAMMTDPGQRQARFDRAETAMCGCGKTVAACSLWGTYLRRHEISIHQSMLSSYQLFIQVASGVLADDGWISDSSKSPKALATLSQLAGIAEEGITGLKVLFLTRDVRSFIASELGRSKKGGLVAALRLARFWKKTSEEYLAFVQGTQLPFLHVGYEELCLFPDYVMRTIAAFLEIPFSEQMLSPSAGSSHVATGNPMRVDPQRNRKTLYDNRWFFRRDVAIASSLIPGALRLNRELVYHNTAPGSLDSFRPPFKRDEP